jgi:hypothetical protein
MSQHQSNQTREQRYDELVAMWRSGKRQQASVLRLCHRTLPEGQSLQAGTSIIEKILDYEFGGNQDHQAVKA